MYVVAGLSERPLWSGSVFQHRHQQRHLDWYRGHQRRDRAWGATVAISLQRDPHIVARRELNHVLHIAHEPRLAKLAWAWVVRLAPPAFDAAFVDGHERLIIAVS